MEQREGKAGYAAFLRDWSAGVTADKPTATAGAAPTVGQLAAAWLDHAAQKYVKLGKRTSTYHVCRGVAALVADRFADLACADFGLTQLEALRAGMVAKGWVRRTVNDYTTRVVGIFGWGVPRKLAPAEWSRSGPGRPRRPTPNPSARPRPITWPHSSTARSCTRTRPGAPCSRRWFARSSSPGCARPSVLD